MSLPNIVANDFYLEVARGNVLNFAMKELLGLNAAVGGTEDIWNQSGSITQITAAAVLCVSSTDALDIDLEVVVTGLDANYDEITETIITDGTDGQVLVNGSSLFFRVNSVTMAVAPAGKVYVYYGTTATAGVPDNITKVQAAVDIAGTQAYNAIYTVPRNKIWYLSGLRYRSTASFTKNDVIISLIQKLYGGVNTTVETVKYKDLGTTNYVDDQVTYIDHPIAFPAKSEIRFTAGLSGGTALNIAIEANFCEETIVVIPTVVQVIDLAAYLVKLTATGKTLGGQAYWLIGLDEEPAQLPTTAVLADVLTIIPGAINYTVQTDTEVTFDLAYYVSGVLINTSKKAVLTIMRCVNNDASSIDYVLAPVNTVFSLGNVKKIKFLHN